MSDELLDKLRDSLEGQIDFEGQRLAEFLTTALLSIVGIISFLVGYITQDIAKTLWLGLGGTALTLLIIVPPWPFFNRNPVVWLAPQSAISAIKIEVDGKRVG